MKIGTLEMWIQQSANTPFCIDRTTTDYASYQGNVQLEFDVKDNNDATYRVQLGYEMRDKVQPFLSNRDDVKRYGKINGNVVGLVTQDDPIYNLMDTLDLPNQKVFITLYSQDNIVDPQ